MSSKEEHSSSVSLIASVLRRSYLLASLVLIGAGFVLLQWSSEQIDWPRELGTTILASGLISAVWQVAIDKWFKRDMVEAFQSVVRSTDPSLQLLQTRLGDISRSDLDQLLSRSDEVLVTCLYDKRWVDPWVPPVRAYLARGGRFSLCVPDPVDGATLAQLAARHQKANPADFRAAVMDLIKMFQSLSASYPGQVEIRTAPPPGPSYTAYLFVARDGSGAGITRMYGHRMTDGSFLTEQSFRQGGTLFTHYQRDYESLWIAAEPYPRPTPGVSTRPPRIAVIGPGNADARVQRLAEQVGQELGRSDAVLVTGGGGGVMEATARGLVGVRPKARVKAFLPGLDISEANTYVNECVATGKGEARDFDVVGDCDAVIAVGCNEGTLIEALSAHAAGKELFSLGLWTVADSASAIELGRPVSSPKEAVRRALAAARR